MRVAHPGEHFLLSGGAREVALAGRLADPGVGKRLVAVEVMGPGLDREALLVAVLAVVRVAEGTLRR